MRIIAVVILALGAALSSGLAVEPDELLDDPALEARAQAIGARLRCVVCQSQSIEESNAPLAKDLRLLVRERLLKGDSDAEIFDYVVARYGEYVLLKPRFEATTIVLWLFPAFALALGGVMAFALLRSQAGAAPVAISPEEAEELRRLTEERG